VADTAETVRAQFKAFDLDDSSMLDRHEVANLLTMLRISQRNELPAADRGLVRMPTAREIDRAIATMDADGDGLVTLAEFEAWHAKCGQAAIAAARRAARRPGAGRSQQGSRGSRRPGRERPRLPRTEGGGVAERELDSEDRTLELCDQMVQSMPVFDAMGPAECRSMVAVLVPSAYSAGTRIIRQGDRGDAMYILGAGEAAATLVPAPGAPEMEVKQYGRGDFFGEMALLNDAPRKANIVARSDCTCLRIAREDFERVIGEATRSAMTNAAVATLSKHDALMRNRARHDRLENERRQVKEGGGSSGEAGATSPGLVVVWDRRLQRYVRPQTGAPAGRTETWTIERRPTAVVALPPSAQAAPLAEPIPAPAAASAPVSVPMPPQLMAAPMTAPKQTAQPAAPAPMPARPMPADLRLELIEPLPVRPLTSEGDGDGEGEGEGEGEGDSPPPPPKTTDSLSAVEKNLLASQDLVTVPVPAPAAGKGKGKGKGKCKGTDKGKAAPPPPPAAWEPGGASSSGKGKGKGKAKGVKPLAAAVLGSGSDSGDSGGSFSRSDSDEDEAGRMKMLSAQLLGS
jgi:CRP-like cAMP-binding protein